jgi:hypothetical protein
LKMLDDFCLHWGPSLNLLKPAEAAVTRVMMVKSVNFILTDWREFEWLEVGLVKENLELRCRPATRKDKTEQRN